MRTLFCYFPRSDYLPNFLFGLVLFFHEKGLAGELKWGAEREREKVGYERG